MARRANFKPRKQPQQLRSRETVDAIFEAALQVLRKNEEQSPSVHTIAEHAGVSVGSLYQYFPSKEALVSGLIRFYLTQRLGVFERELAAARGLSAEEAAARLIGGFIDSMSARSTIERAIMHQFCRAGDLWTLTQVDDQMNGIVERFLRSLGAEVRAINLELAAFLISNTLRSAVLLSILQKPGRLKDPEFKAELIRLVVRYLRPP
jgi:AcrR family transcriptional regulator